MSNVRAACTLVAAFPITPIPHLVGETAIDPKAPLPTVSDAQEAEVIERVAKWLGENPQVCLGPALPGLWLARDLPISPIELPKRVVAGLTRLGASVWGDVLELSPTMLADVRGFGEGCLHSFLANAARTAFTACRRQQPPRPCPTVGLFETRHFPTLASTPMAVLSRLTEWAHERGAMSIADLLDSLGSSPLPQDIAAFVAQMRAIPLSDLWPASTVHTPLEDRVVDLCGVLDARSYRIFLARISLNCPRTLEDLAAEFGVSKERVRQIGLRAEERVHAALTAPQYASIGWRAHALSVRLGLGVPGDSDQLTLAFREATHGVTEANCGLVLNVLSWRAGPYTM